MTNTCSCFKQHLFLCEKILSQADYRSRRTIQITRSKISRITQDKTKRKSSPCRPVCLLLSTELPVLCRLTSREYVLDMLVNTITITKSYLASYINLFNILLFK